MPFALIPLNTSFTITLTYNYKSYRYPVRKTAEQGLMEEWTVFTRSQQLVFSSNRMVWRSRGVKHNDYTLRLIKGECKFQSLRDDIAEAIKKEIKKLELNTQ
jgi:hypothetical protein